MKDSKFSIEKKFSSLKNDDYLDSSIVTGNFSKSLKILNRCVDQRKANVTQERFESDYQRRRLYSD